MNEPPLEVIVINQTLGPFFHAMVSKLADRGLNVRVFLGSDEQWAHPNISVVRGPRYRRSGMLSRFISWLAFAVFIFHNSFRWKRGTVIMFASNPPFVLHALWLPQRLKGFTLVANVLDIYPDILRSHRTLAACAPVFWLWSAANRIAYKGCSRVITLGEAMADLLGRYAPRERITIVHNWYTLDIDAVPARHENPLREELGLQGKCVLLYSGNIGLSHDIGVLVDLAEHFREDAHLHVLIIGEGNARASLVNRAQAAGLRNVTFLPYQPEERLPVSLGAGDVSVVSLRPECADAFLPSKVYGYLGAGSAILGIGGTPCDVEALIRQHDCGYFVKSGDKDALVETVREALNRPEALRRMGERAREAALCYYSKERCCDQIAEVIADALAGKVR